MTFTFQSTRFSPPAATSTIWVAGELVVKSPFGSRSWAFTFLVLGR